AHAVVVAVLRDEPAALRGDRVAHAAVRGRAARSGDELRPGVADMNREHRAAELAVAADRAGEVLRELRAVGVVIDDAVEAAGRDGVRLRDRAVADLALRDREAQRELIGDVVLRGSSRAVR